jgi:hypothetical protein
MFKYFKNVEFFKIASVIYTRSKAYRPDDSKFKSIRQVFASINLGIGYWYKASFWFGSKTFISESLKTKKEQSLNDISILINSCKTFLLMNKFWNLISVS